LGKAAALRAALRGGLMTELIVDEPTARALLWPERHQEVPPSPEGKGKSK
jgi:putative sugar-binding domain-containing protein